MDTARIKSLAKRYGIPVVLAFVVVVVSIIWFRAKKENPALSQMIRDAGYIPLSHVDYVKIVQPGEPTYADESLLGAIVPWSDMQRDGKHFTLSSQASPIRPSYSYRLTLREGAEKILQELLTKFDGKVIGKGGKLTRLHANGEAQDRVELSQVWHGALDIAEEQQAAFFISALPISQKDARFFWVTRFVAADVKNVESLHLDSEFSSTSFPFQGSGGQNRVVNGAGLLLGVDGFTVNVQRLGVLDSTRVPEPGASSKEIRFKAESDGWSPTIVLTRVNELDVCVEALELPNATTCVKYADDVWELDRPGSQSMARKLTLATTQPNQEIRSAGARRPPTSKVTAATRSIAVARFPASADLPGAKLGEKLVRVALFETEHASGVTTIASLVMLPLPQRDSAVGRAYEVKGAVYKMVMQRGVVNQN